MLYLRFIVDPFRSDAQITRVSAVEMLVAATKGCVVCLGIDICIFLGKNTWIPFGAPSTDVDLSESTQEALMPIGLC